MDSSILKSVHLKFKDVSCRVALPFWMVPSMMECGDMVKDRESEACSLVTEMFFTDLGGMILCTERLIFV